MHNLIFWSGGIENRIKTGWAITPDWPITWFFFTVSFDLENMCTVAKLSLLDFFLLSYHIIYILGKIWAQEFGAYQQNRAP